MSTDSASPGPEAFDVETPLRLSPSVAIRPEPFGAIAYDFTTRRLSVLRSMELVHLVQQLDGSSLETAFDALGIAAPRRRLLQQAIAKLIRDGMIQPTPQP